MSKKFKTSYGTAGGSTYGYKSAAEAKRARAKSAALNTKKKTHTHSYNHEDVGRDVFGKGGYNCTSCGQKK